MSVTFTPSSPVVAADSLSAMPQPPNPPLGASQPPKEYDVGVLFVHGIGQQQRGQTLTQFGDALIEWGRAWIRGSSAYDATLVQLGDALSAWVRQQAPVAQKNGDTPVQLGDALVDWVHLWTPAARMCNEALTKFGDALEPWARIEARIAETEGTELQLFGEKLIGRLKEWRRAANEEEDQALARFGDEFTTWIKDRLTFAPNESATQQSEALIGWVRQQAQTAYARDQAFALLVDNRSIWMPGWTQDAQVSLTTIDQFADAFVIWMHEQGQAARNRGATIEQFADALVTWTQEQAQTIATSKRTFRQMCAGLIEWAKSWPQQSNGVAQIDAQFLHAFTKQVGKHTGSAHVNIGTFDQFGCALHSWVRDQAQIAAIQGQTLVQLGDALAPWLRQQTHDAQNNNASQVGELLIRRTRIWLRALRRQTQPIVQFGDALTAWVPRWAKDAQARGTTVEQFGRELTAWVPCWTQANKVPIETRDSIVDDLTEDPTVPAHISLTVRTPSTLPLYDSPWLMAESWWADAFTPSSFQELAVWGWRVLPWTIFAHFFTRIRRSQEWWNQSPWARVSWLVNAPPLKWLRTCGLWIWYFGASLIAIAVTEFLVLLLLILVLLPIPWLGTLATRLQQILAGYLGDSYVLLISPVRAEAIVTRVRRDFEWLAAKCKTVAIVAHSQGAAVSYLMLQKGISSEFQSRQVLLCTFGSGLSKLESARAIQEQWTTGYWPILGFFIAALCSTFLFLRISTSTITSALVWIALAVSIGVIFVSLRRIYKSSKLPADDYAPLKRFGKETIWMDYYASRDPVPNGRLFDDTPDYFTKDNGRSTEVYNNAWFLTDHSTYWKNRDGFVGAITCAVGELAENLAPERFGRLRPLDAVRIELAMCRRRWRVGWLAWTRRVAAAAAAVLIFMRWDDLDEFGKFLRSEIDMVNQTPFSFTIAPLLPFYNYASLRITGILGVTVAVMIAYYTLRMVWKFWEVRDVRLFFLRSRYDLTGSAVFLLMGSGWLALAVGVALGWTPPLPKLELAQLVGDLVTAILLPPVIIGGVYMLSGIILSNIIEFARLLETIAELLVTFARRQAAWLISYAFHLRAACYNRQMAFDAILIRSYVFCLAVGALILWYQFASPAATSDVKGNVALLVAVMVCVVGWSKLPAWLRARGGVGHPATALEILASDAERDRVKALLEACRVVNSNDQSVREALEKVAKKPKATKYAGRPTVAGR